MEKFKMAFEPVNRDSRAAPPAGPWGVIWLWLTLLGRAWTSSTWPSPLVRLRLMILTLAMALASSSLNCSSDSS
jgi:hypothetical protein